MMLVAGVAVVVLALDQITKFVALEQLPPGSPVPVVDGFLALTLVLNPGLAFGIFSATS
ncbi:MAG: signal peptidase II, partial [Candidatus Methylomirabilia bacterium]